MLASSIGHRSWLLTSTSHQQLLSALFVVLKFISTIVVCSLHSRSTINIIIVHCAVQHDFLPALLIKHTWIRRLYLFSSILCLNCWSFGIGWTTPYSWHFLLSTPILSVTILAWYSSTTSSTRTIPTILNCLLCWWSQHHPFSVWLICVVVPTLTLSGILSVVGTHQQPHLVFFLLSSCFCWWSVGSRTPAPIPPV